MAATAPTHTHWIPEDDLLLKNAVEAGASLESLAKGAVQFSHRFTMQELQERWYSLLYDPVVSEEASEGMIEHERMNHPRPNKPENLKETISSSGKRKAESVRKCYYAMRKRIRNETFDMMNINLPLGPGHPNYEDGNGVPSTDRIVGNPVLNNLGIGGSDFNIEHPFSEIPSCAAESTANGVTPCLSTGQNHGQDLQPGGGNVSQNLLYRYDENISITGDHGEIPEFDQSKQLPVCDLFEAEGLENNPNACSEFGVQSFDGFGCSPPQPQMPTWTTPGNIAGALLHDQPTGNTFVLPQAGYADGTGGLRYDDPCSNSNLKNSMSCASTSHLNPNSKDYFSELYNAFFDLTDVDGLHFMDSDGKDTFDRSYFEGSSSPLFDSPNPTEFPVVSLGEPVMSADVQIVGISGTHSLLSDGMGEHHSDQRKLIEAKATSSASTMKCGPEYRNGVICCTLNTEDPEIPSNDDVFLPFVFPSSSDSSKPYWISDDHSFLLPSSVKDVSVTRKVNGGPSMRKNSKKNTCVASRAIGSSQPSDVGSKYKTGEQWFRFELPKSNIEDTALRQCPNRVQGSSNNFISGVVKDGAKGMEHGKAIEYKSDSTWLDKHVDARDVFQGLQNSASGSRKEADAKAEFPNNGASNDDLTTQKPVVPEPIDKPLMSDPEEQFSENDFDVPSFSDVEAMILDMDLSPDEFDLYTNPAVQRYQHEESKRTIMRLEKAANACSQRAIAAQGAFAALYGRCSKYFIKKPEVLLGRGTEDVRVDIDLGREKNGGKISRRQAIIKMDMHGKFHMKNLGKASIYMNGWEVAPGQSVGLASGCLVRIRGLAFVFETNQARVKQHTDNIMRGSLFLDHKPS